MRSRSTREATTVSSEQARMSTLPSTVVLDQLLTLHAGNPPREALRQAGFRSHDVDAYLERRSARSSGCTASPCPGG
jgi:hypothetical protein